jgi:hypothetical protein
MKSLVLMQKIHMHQAIFENYSHQQQLITLSDKERLWLLHTYVGY